MEDCYEERLEQKIHDFLIHLHKKLHKSQYSRRDLLWILYGKDLPTYSPTWDSEAVSNENAPSLEG